MHVQRLGRPAAVYGSCGSDALFAACVVLLVCVGGLTFLACACAFRGFLLVSTTRQLPRLFVTQGNQGRHDPHHHVLQFLRALLEILGANPGAQTRRKHLKRSLQLHMGMPPDTGNIQWIRDGAPHFFISTTGALQCKLVRINLHHAVSYTHLTLPTKA